MLNISVGDTSSALAVYKRACRLDPSNPLPFLSAARVYQQLQLYSLSSSHMQRAAEVDPSLAMTFVDMAQANIMTVTVASGADYCFGRSEDELLLRAVSLCRHVSEVVDVLTAQMVAGIYNELSNM